MKDFEGFDVELITKNIVAIAKYKGIRVGELEDMIGVQRGYFARYSKEHKTDMYLSTFIKCMNILGFNPKEVLYTDVADTLEKFDKLFKEVI